MGVPVSQMWTVARYVLGKKLRGEKRYPLVLMLEPLFRCNLACAGCGKIQYPGEILKQNLSPEDCFRAVDECGAPMVSIPGGEPLLHPQIDEIVAGLVARKKYVYLCTNAILLEKHLHRFQPSKYLSFSIHLDGPRAEHDHAVCRDGVYDVAIQAVQAAIAAGHRVTTNTTLFNTADPERMREMFDTLMDLGVEGMMLSPGYSYEKAPDQEHFLHRRQTMSLFRRILRPQGRKPFSRAPQGSAPLDTPTPTNPSTIDDRPSAVRRRRRWTFNQSPLFIEFLKGNFDLECTPWGNPTFNIFGWQKPCYLIQDGYVATFRELMETTDWSAYGRASGNSKCGDCMVHCGHEPSAVNATFGSLKGLLATARVTLFGSLPERELSHSPPVAPNPSLPEPVLVQLDLAN